MEYASVYALQNWARKDPAGGIEYPNLKLIRAFESHEGSEKGFMYVYPHSDTRSHVLTVSTQTRPRRYGMLLHQW
jgi:hypothetical protein